MIEANCKTPSPFKVNCWKHHAEFIAKQINKIMKEEELETLPAILLKIGGSQMDLYLGKLAPVELMEFIKRFLKKHKVFEYEPYKQWLFSEGKEYRLVTLPDKSTWTLRMGNQRENYIHTHPGRYSTHTIRVRALTLKTAICVMVYLNIYKISSPDLQLINSLRKEFLEAEPVKSPSSTSGLMRLLNVFKKV